jgi:hypothetical protein
MEYKCRYKDTSQKTALARMDEVKHESGRQDSHALFILFTAVVVISRRCVYYFILPCRVDDDSKYMYPRSCLSLVVVRLEMPIHRA